MRSSVIIFLVLQSICCAWSQVDRGLDYNKIVDQLEQEIHKGKKRALRDLGSLLDKNEINQKIRSILSKTTFFIATEIDVNQSSKLDFLSFYYDNEQKIQYSELLGAFYIISLEDRKISFEMKPVAVENENNNTVLIRLYFMDLDEMLRSKKTADANQLIEKVSTIKAVNKERLLLNLLLDKRLKEIPIPLRNDFYKNILNQLTEFPQIEIVETILKLLEEGNLSEDFATPLLLKITNCKAPFQAHPEQILSHYQNLIDSLGSLDELRKYGYDQVFKFKVNFFQFPVDYYGKILGNSDNFPWIRQNALLDLKRSTHPRALFYIAADFYRTRKEAGAYSEINHLQLIKAKTNVEIGIQNQNGEVTFYPERNDETAMLNYLIYWAAAYEDYDWDENRNLFISKMASFAKTQNYERLFRRFNSKNDSIALLSFLQLTEGDPIEVINLAKKYRQLLRNHNSTLPSMKYKYLEQLTLLTAFCRKNKINYKPSRKLLNQIVKLAKSSDQKERYLIENQLIESLSLTEITALEYWACVYEKNENLALSAGRILDWFYSKNWEKIIENNQNLRFYLKKSYLFGNIGVIGICNNYLNKFDLSDKNQLNRLYELGNIESDKDILSQILLLLEQEPQEEFTTYNFEDFLELPLLFNQRDLKILPPPKLSELKQIVALIQKREDVEEIKKLFAFLRLHPKLAYVPELFKLIDDQRIISKRGDLEVTVADNIIPIIENIYSFEAPNENPNHPFETKYWRTLWKKNGASFKQWGDGFYKLKLERLASKKSLSIDDINQLTRSAYYSKKYAPTILTALKKVRPIKNIRRLDVEPKLSITEDLKYFKDFIFTYKVLDDIPKLFEINNKNAEKMISFLVDKSSTFNYSEKGSFYNNLFRAPWLNNFVNSGKLAPENATIIKIAFTEYLNESTFLSEFEEQATILNISKLENIGKSLDAKLQAVLQMEVDQASKVKILEEIIAAISYAEIGDIVAHFDELNEILGDETCAFFHRDFGLPIFQIKNQKEQKTLLHKHRNLSEFAFYKYYLQKFGVDFLDKNKNLDLEKINDILQFDIISPFAGEGGTHRDEYVFGIVRLLEIKYNISLGFHEKLNEYQTFYRFSSTKRAEAWINFFQQNKLIREENTMPSSFNKTKKQVQTISENSVRE